MGDDRIGVYRDHYRQLGRACLDLSLGGFQVDERRRQALAKEAAATCETLRREIKKRAACDLFGKGKRKGEPGKGLSNPKVMGYFYDTLRCRAYIKRGTGSRTCDEVSIRKLMRAYVKARPVGQAILDFRMWQKRGEFLAASRVDDDGRFRALYVPNAETGRLTSSKNPLGTGSNGQNVPRAPSTVRSIFVPDRGHVLLEVDESQAEDRIVGGMSGDREMMRLALAGPEVDVHRINAALLFDVEPEDVTGEQRQLGKRVKHAANYGMEGQRMSETALVETEGQLVLDPRECDAWLTKLHALRPGIPAYHEYIRARLLRYGYLENSWGRRIYFRRLRLAKEDYKQAYAWTPQAEVGVLMNQWGVLPAWKFCRRWPDDMRIVQQGHDSIVLSCLPTRARELIAMLRASLNRPRTYQGAKGPWTLAMPVEFKTGPHWGAMRRVE